MSQTIYNEFFELKKVADETRLLFDSVCRNRIDYYLNKLEPELTDEEINALEGFMRKVLWDRYPIVNEIRFNLVDKNNESSIKYLRYLKSEVEEIIFIVKHDSEMETWAYELDFLTDVINGGVAPPESFKLSLLGDKSSFERLYSRVHSFIVELKSVSQFIDQELNHLGIKTGYSAMAPKLRWKGSQKQLFSVLRQLKDKGYLMNSFDELAEFLILNVEGNEHLKTHSLSKNIQKRDEPKKGEIEFDENL